MSADGRLRPAPVRQDVVVDVRCLQNPHFRYRGVGQHAASLLEGVHSHAPAGFQVNLIAAVDRALPPLDAAHRALFAAEQWIGSPAAPGALLVQMSPMTHPFEPLQRMFASTDLRSVAAVYDFIPLEFAGLYLSNPGERAAYLHALTTLGEYDCFVSISEFTSSRLQQLLEIEPGRCHVSGVAVRDGVVAAPARDPPVDPYVLAVLGDDPRKNAEAVVAAHGGSFLLQARGVRLKVLGRYGPAARARLERLHRERGGDPSRLDFIEQLSDQQLAATYAGALVTVCPSRAEGFSLPVVEANANGCPVLVSSCGAQTELMPLADFQFEADDYDRLRELIEAFVDPDLARRALARQGWFWRRFEPAAVQARFWGAAFAHIAPCSTPVVEAPFVARRTRPRIAVASPMPPDRSGVADYTSATMAALARRADLDLYTPTQAPIRSRSFATTQPLSRAPYVLGRHDAVVSVIGNSHLHLEIFNLLLEHGGACVAHDARMAHFYAEMLGPERTAGVASRELGRPVPFAEVETWLVDERRMPAMFLSEILESAQPTFVHSAVTRDLISKAYGAEAVHLPFAVYRSPLLEFQGPGGRARARRLLGYDDLDRLVISLGDIGADKAIEEGVSTLAMLRSGGVPAHLALAGRGDPALMPQLRKLIDGLGMTDFVKILEGPVDERIYQALIAAADAALQFRRSDFGGLSGALMDEIAVGLPAVANISLATAMDAPSYVATIPDDLSPALAAERLAAMFDLPGRDRNEEDRRAFVAAHHVDGYALKMLQGLGLG